MGLLNLIEDYLSTKMVKTQIKTHSEMGTTSKNLHWEGKLSHAWYKRKMTYKCAENCLATGWCIPR